MISQSQRDRAFGLGSDARVHGIPATANPWQLDADKGIGSLYWNWNAGFTHVSKYWGVDNTRYVILALPGIRKLPWERHKGLVS